MGQMEARAQAHDMSGEFRCVVCGESFVEERAACTLYEDGRRRGDLCPKCLIAGPEGAAQRARAVAGRLREKAVALEALADSVARASVWCTLEELREAEQRGLGEGAGAPGG